jgi:phage replication-related protein YjqB (UPF0714/DUF867 family)
MPDKYDSFSELAKKEKQGRDFRVRLRECQGTTVVIVPHGGGIEPGTSEVAEAIAGDDISFYALEGIKPNGNSDLHITSTRFDEPRCIALVTASPRAMSVHGEGSDEQVVFLGGRDVGMGRRLRSLLLASGFTVKTHPDPKLQGCHEANICNRGTSARGVQLELSKGLRRTFFQSLSSKGRQTKTERFDQFVAAVRRAIL